MTILQNKQHTKNFVMSVTAYFDLFFDLPGEIREHILGYLLIKPKGINIYQYPLEILSLARSQAPNTLRDHDYADEDEDYGPSWPLNYFLVSQTFNREATAIYFRENTFHILAKCPKMLFFHNPDSLHGGASKASTHNFKAPRSGDALFNNPTWTRSRRRIRKAVVYIQRPRGLVKGMVFEPLLDMILAGGLKELEFRVGFEARSGSVLSSDIMRGMYRVLTDPDLVVANLSVPSQDHGGAWCPFHGERGFASCCGAVLDGNGDGVGPGSMWIRLDLAALIRQHGEVEDQLRILKVGD